jgi:hypothetical protein
MNISGNVGPDTVFSVGEIEKAFFQNCHVAAGQDPLKRALLKDGVLRRCKSDGCWVHGAMVTNVHIEHLAGGGRMGTWFRGCIFSNVVLSGRLASSQWQRQVSNNLDLNIAFEADAAKRYESISMAIDITGATFSGFTIFEGIPPKLIRRDESRQFLLRPESVQAVRAISSTLAVVCRVAQSEPEGVVFTWDGASGREKQRAEEWRELRRQGLLQ